MALHKFLIEHAIWPAMEKRKGNKIREIQRALEKSQYEDVAALQRERLTELLLHCKAHVPAYESVLPDEDTIRSILAKIGKESPEQELNCGACGYNSCREKAIAVYLNKAELTMCVPYMKERAESLSNYVLSETPNITIMVDDEMNIIEFNKAAEECFKISRREALEKGLFELIDSSDFQFVLETKQPITNKKVHYKEYGITTEQSIIYIDKQNIVMGIFKDITKEEREQENLYDLRVETMEMAQKVIDKQMVAAQQIASLLGETTAETKVTLTKLKNMIVFDGDE